MPTPREGMSHEVHLADSWGGRSVSLVIGFRVGAARTRAPKDRVDNLPLIFLFGDLTPYSPYSTLHGSRANLSPRFPYSPYSTLHGRESPLQLRPDGPLSAPAEARLAPTPGHVVPLPPVSVEDNSRVILREMSGCRQRRRGRSMSTRPQTVKDRRGCSSPGSRGETVPRRSPWSSCWRSEGTPCADRTPGLWEVGLFELRGKEVRLFYRFRPGRRVVLLDGEIKKRNEIPKRVLARVRGYLKDAGGTPPAAQRRRRQ